MTKQASSRILVVDDESASRELLEIILKEEGYEPDTVADGAAALDRLATSSYDVVVSDLQMPGLDGVALTQEIRSRLPSMEVLILTAFGSQERAHEVGRLQADYLRKPFDRSDFLHRIARMVERSRMARELAHLRATLQSRHAAGGIIGHGPAMRAVLEKVEAVARTDYPVLLSGASGTGKELVAEAIHRASPRAAAPFVAVNCGAIPTSLFESELFGHVRGAFTGAVVNRAGLFEEAGGGTIFLDEIGEIALEMQVKLLRVLQSSEIKRVGSPRTVRVDVRLVCATNRDLSRLVEEGRFREDLYYRIHVVPIRLPPLRDRPEDIPALARHFLSRANVELPEPARGFTPAAIQKLVSNDWPGNVRELENRVKQAAIAAAGRDIGVDDLFLDDRPRAATVPARLFDADIPFEEAKNRFERELLVRCLEQHDGVVTRAADALRMHRNSVYHLLRKHGIDPASLR